MAPAASCADQTRLLGVQMDQRGRPRGPQDSNQPARPATADDRRYASTGYEGTYSPPASRAGPMAAARVEMREFRGPVAPVQWLPPPPLPHAAGRHYPSDAAGPFRAHGMSSPRFDVPGPSYAPVPSASPSPHMSYATAREPARRPSPPRMSPREDPRMPMRQPPPEGRDAAAANRSVEREAAPVVRYPSRISHSNPTCSNCFTTATPLWRRDGRGGLMCESWRETSAHRHVDLPAHHSTHRQRLRAL